MEEKVCSDKFKLMMCNMLLGHKEILSENGNQITHD
jgi:hypothetical protein